VATVASRDRLFQDKSGWTPHYTSSGVDRNYDQSAWAPDIFRHKRRPSSWRVLLDESQIRVILLDIEGTTTPVDFVYKTLFPYASRKVESFLRERVQDPEIQSLIKISAAT